MSRSKERWVFSVQMDVDPQHVDLFNEVYDEEHVPALLLVPGVRSVQRIERSDQVAVKLAGEVHVMKADSTPRFAALYEIDGPTVLTSREWADAVDAGRWSTHVRPFTTNRQHSLYKTISYAQEGDKIR